MTEQIARNTDKLNKANRVLESQARAAENFMFQHVTTKSALDLDIECH